MLDRRPSRILASFRLTRRAVSSVLGFADAVLWRLAALGARGVAFAVAGWYAAGWACGAADADVVGCEVDVVP